MEFRFSKKRIVSFVLSIAMLFSFAAVCPTVYEVEAAAETVWQFDFGNGGTASGFTSVDASTSYDSSRGYGFRNTGSVTNVSASGSNELSDAVRFTSTDTQNTFDVDLPNGLYEITVYLGDTTRTSVRAEDCLQLINLTGNNATDAFQIPITDGQLNIMATEGKANYPFTLSSLIIKKVSDDTTTPPTVWICGDSTVCNYYPLDTSTQAGWGQVLGEYIDTNYWLIRNLAASGQYAKGFVDSGCFDTILKYGKEGDIYIISIGINDTNYSNSTEYKEVVGSMAQQATAKGMEVVLVKQQGRSSDVSRSPLLTGRWFGTQLDEIGSEQNLQVVDLFNLAQDYFVSIGQDATYELYMDGDTLHPNREGAKVLAKIISEQVDFSTISHADDTIYIAGDSTVQSYNSSYAPQQGWGYYLKDYLDYDFSVVNHAIAGRSSKSFYDQGRLQSILDIIEDGDYLLVQFGINDASSSNAERYAPICGNVENATEGSYEYYIKFYVEGALEKGATPVLISPVLGLKSYSNGQFVPSYTGHADALQKIADYYDVPFINLNQLMVDNYNSIGYDAAYKFHMCGAVDGSTDMTHFCEAGAENAAKLLASELNDVIKEIDKGNTQKRGAYIPNGKYMIKGYESGLYLDVAGGTAANGTNVQIWGAYGLGSQNTWNLKSAGNGYYQIYSCVGDGSYLLDLDYGKTDDGTNIQIYQNTYCDAQLFKFYEVMDGKYAILTKSSNDHSALDVYGHGTGSGTNVCQWTYSGGYNQLFELIAVQDSIESANVTLSSSSMTYTGSECKPDVTVTYNGGTLTLNTDYTVSYSNNVNVGTATVTITGIGNYTGTVTKTFEIVDNEKSISDCTITLSKTSFTYTGSACKPKVTVTYGNTTLTLNTDYAVRYIDNVEVGTASVKISGKGDYTGSVTKTFTITASTSKNLSDCTISLSKTVYKSDGTARKPKVTITDGNTTLTLGTDYLVRYVDNIELGTASVIIAGRGSYTGRITKTFTILDPNAKQISECEITLSKTTFTYTGNTCKPKVTVKDGDTVLTIGTDYNIRYVDNVNVGTATVVVSGTGKYQGIVYKTFSIVS